MSKLNLLLVLRLFSVAIALFLVSCGGQPTISEDDAPAVKKADADKAALSQKEQAQKEQEPPSIELIPRKDLDGGKISMEPLPADESVEEPAKQPEISAEATSGEIKQESSVKEAMDSSALDAKSQDAEVKEVTKEEPPVVAAPAIKPAPKPVEAPAQKPQISPPVAKAAPLQLPTEPNTFLVTVGPKAAPHPSLGKGHAMGFLVNGVSGKRLVLERGKSYTFDIRTDAKHDVYLSKKVIGWGSAPIAEGVTGAYTYKGKMVFSPTASTPDNVYYACRNHPHMGALIQIVNPGEKAQAIKQSSPSTGAADVPRVAVTKVTASKVKQKLMFAEMMSKSKGSKRVLASQNDEAKKLLVNAKSLLSEGREKSLVGALPEALALANKSLRMMSEASRLVPGEEEMAILAENYKTSLTEIRDYQKSHKANLARLQKRGSVPEGALYDVGDVTQKLAEAQALADKRNYIHANAVLGKVQRTITVALHKMLDSTTLVYDLNFETAADEYEYELKRFVGYEELIPVAIEAKKPAPGAIKLMESFHEKARKRRDQAVAKAAAGEYGDAIAMLQQATKTVRRALRMVGVMQ